METAERRNEIMRTLYRRKHEIISNLAVEFGVSERTIRRDIQILSLTNPIYTQPGRYHSGVFVLNGYSTNRIYLSAKESEVLHKIDMIVEMNFQHFFTAEEINTFKRIVNDYTRFKTELIQSTKDE